MEMINHSDFEESLPLYAAGQLDKALRVEIAQHLDACASCRADLEMWAVVSGEIRSSSRQAAAPPDLANRALRQAGIHGKQSFRGKINSALQLLRAQVFLVHREMWPASAAIMLMGVVIALLSKHIEAVYFIAPLVAAASLTVLFGPANDPAYELVMATPTSPWRMLLARLSIVSAYNLVLTLIAGLFLLLIIPPNLFGSLILGWLGPMAFLSALALLISLWIGTGNAVTISYFLWILQYIPYQYMDNLLASSGWESLFQAYQSFWHNPLLLFSLSVVLVFAALASTGRPLFNLNSEIV
ncbi:MAG: anti-sigma factor [Anaerolineaceae bacterium]